MHTPGMTDSSPASQDHEMENEQPVRAEKDRPWSITKFLGAPS
jgi:hypothetical protein